MLRSLPGQSLERCVGCDLGTELLSDRLTPRANRHEIAMIALAPPCGRNDRPLGEGQDTAVQSTGKTPVRPRGDPFTEVTHLGR